MEQCANCDRRIDIADLGQVVSGLRNLSPQHFNVCSRCVTVVQSACIECGCDVYVPRSTTKIPDYCPDCRYDIICTTGEDPGWRKSIIKETPNQ